MATFVPKKNRVEIPAVKTNESQDHAVAQSADDLIVVARIGVAYGIKGWVKIHPFSHSPDALQNARRWWIAPYIPEQKNENTSWQQVKPKGFKPHTDVWVGTCEGWIDRTYAEQFKGWQVAVSRSEFPQTDEDEFYWVDLLDAQVVNQEGAVLGVVTELFENAAHTVMHVVSQTSASTNTAKSAEYLIPFVSAFVGQVDVQSIPKTIAVVWDVDATA